MLHDTSFFQKFQYQNRLEETQRQRNSLTLASHQRPLVCFPVSESCSSSLDRSPRGPPHTASLPAPGQHPFMPASISLLLPMLELSEFSLDLLFFPSAPIGKQKKKKGTSAHRHHPQPLLFFLIPSSFPPGAGAPHLFPTPLPEEGAVTAAD